MGLKKYLKYFKKLSEKKLLIGLTGTIGSGKTTVLNIFKRFGTFTISSDEIVSEILTRKKICDKIIKRYQSVKKDHLEIDKVKLGAILFKNVRAKRFIENLIHPLVIEEIIKEIKKTKSGVVVVEVPLLFEKGLESFFNLVVCVFARKDIRRKRLLKKGMNLMEVFEREKHQFNDEFKIRFSDIVIDNSFLSPSDLEKKVYEIFQTFKKLS
jgi:dephospho-CoA kinase